MNKIRTVVLVDDDELDNLIHDRMLRKADFGEILQFTYAEEALAFLESQKPSDYILIFVDINMPRMSGFEFVEACKHLPQETLTKLVVVLLTTSQDSSEIERANSNRLISQFVTKPLTSEAIQSIVQKYDS